MKRLPLSRMVFAAAFLSLGSPLLVPDCASACSCAQQLPEEAFSRSEAVFAGEVVDVGEPHRQQPGLKSSADPVPVTFRVSEVWKEPEEETIEVTTASDDASCGYSFREGESYLVYASEGMQVDLCSGTKQLSAAEAELETLGPGDAPSEEQEGGTTGDSSLPESGGVFASLTDPARTVLAGVVAVALVSVAALAKKRLGS